MFVFFFCVVHLQGADTPSTEGIVICGLACHFKTDPTETITLCFGYPKTPCLRAEGKLSSKQMNRPFVCWRWLGITNKQYIWDYLLIQDFQRFIYYYSVGCSARSLRSNHVPHRRYGRLYLDYLRETKVP
jgi:hypothetical protein